MESFGQLEKDARGNRKREPNPFVTRMKNKFSLSTVRLHMVNGVCVCVFSFSRVSFVRETVLVIAPLWTPGLEIGFEQLRQSDATLPWCQFKRI